MPLSPEQISKMDEALGGKSQMSPDIISEMDAVVNGNAQPQQDITKTQSALAGASDLASFALDPKIRGFGAALGQTIGEKLNLRPDTETPFPDLYAQKRNEIENATKMAEEQNPLSYTGVQVAGALLQAILTPGSIFSSSGKVFGRGFTEGAKQLGKNILQTGAVSVPAATAYGFNKSSGDIGDKLESAKDYAIPAVGASIAFPVAGAVIGGLGGAAIKGTKNIIASMGARGEDVIGEALGAIKDGSRALYSAADNAGVLAKPEAVQPLLDNLSGVVKNKDIASQKLYSSTLGAIKDLGDDIAAGNTGLMTLDRHRQILGNLAKDITNPNKAQEAEAAGRAIGFIDDFIENLTPDKLLSGDVSAVNALTAARAEWSKSKRFEKIGQIIVNASNDANKLKRDLEKFRTNPKNTLGWSESELEALKQASTQTTGEGVLKLLGKFGFDLGGSRPVGNTALPIISGLASGIGASSTGIGALVPIVGTAARSAQKALASGKAEQLLKVIEQGGKVTNKMVAELPKSEQNKFLSKVMQMPVAKATRIFTTKDKVK